MDHASFSIEATSPSPPVTGVQLLNSLFVTRGNDCGKSYTLTDQTITIGRDRENSILVNDDEVSRVHCSIFVESSRVYLVDEGSSNGTFLNGKAVTRAEVHKGDKIRIGKTQFEFNSFLQISLDQKNASPLTASPTRVHKSSLEPTKFIEQSETETDSISLELEEFSNSENLVAGQRFVQIKNDLKFVYQASLATSRTLDIHQMFHELMELIFDWIPADRGCVFLRDQQTGELETKYVKKRELSDDSSTNKIPSTKIKVDKTIVDYVAKHKIAVLSPGIAPDSELQKRMDTSQTEAMVDEVMCVPLEAHNNILGVLYIDTLTSPTTASDARFNRDNLRMMLAMAQQAAVAIENASFLESQIEKERDFALSQISTFMEHRMNNILQGINGGAHLVEAGLNSENLDLCKKGWEIASNNQTRIAELVSDLMVLSNPLTFNRQPCNLVELLTQAAESLKPSLDEANLTCQFPHSHELFVSVDRSSMKTCLDYLFKMVIESAQHHGTLLEFSISQNQAELQLRIRHPGPPIRAPKNSTSNPNKQACSIAFAIVQKIVEAHRGQVTIGSVSTSKSASQWISEAVIGLPLRN